jgi:hypothetical protein
MLRLEGGISSERSGFLGVDRSQAALFFEAFDLVKEIGQTCDRSATVRPASPDLG